MNRCSKRSCVKFLDYFHCQRVIVGRCIIPIENDFIFCNPGLVTRFFFLLALPEYVHSICQVSFHTSYCNLLNTFLLSKKNWLYFFCSKTGCFLLLRLLLFWLSRQAVDPNFIRSNKRIGFKTVKTLLRNSFSRFNQHLSNTTSHKAFPYLILVKCTIHTLASEIPTTVAICHTPLNFDRLESYCVTSRVPWELKMKIQTLDKH